MANSIQFEIECHNAERNRTTKYTMEDLQKEGERLAGEECKVYKLVVRHVDKGWTQLYVHYLNEAGQIFQTSTIL